MYPVLLRLGPVSIHAYGLLLALSFLIGIYWAVPRGARRGIAQKEIMDLSLIVVLCAIIGSRFLYVVTHLDEFKGRWLDVISPIQSTGEFGIAGLSMMGGVVLTLIALVLFTRKRKISFYALGDTLAPLFAMGIFLTRIGCFLNGCCFGKPGDLPWCVIFPPDSPAGATLEGQHLHPTQLYSSLYGLLILGILLLFERKARPTGFSMALFMILYGVGRFMVDFLRYYESSVLLKVFRTSLTINQVISLGIFLVGLIILFQIYRKRKSAQSS